MENNSDPIKKQIELNSLIEFSQLINSNLDLDFIFGNILLSIMGKMMISKGLFLVRQQNKGENNFIISSIKGISRKYANTEIEFEFPRLSIFTLDDIKEYDNFFRTNGFNFFFKIYFANKVLGVLCLGKKINGSIINKEETIFIETLLNISAPAIENSLKFNEIKILNDDQNVQINQLKSLFELSKELNTNFLDREKIIRLLNYTLLGNFGVKDLLIFTKFRSEKFYLLNKGNELYSNEEFLKSLEEIKDTIKIQDNKDNFAINTLHKENYKIIFPIRSGEKIDAIVCLGSKLNKRDYTEEDMQFLESILNLSMMSIDNTILFNEYIEKQKMESELLIAREMQVALLPKELPEIKDYMISAMNVPALHVGGDYYDVVKLSDTKFAIAIADVSGKGTPASLLMSNIQSALHSFLKLYDEDKFVISEVTEKINELIYENTTIEKFITFFWGILDTEKNTFTYINAGHNPPIHVCTNGISYLDKGGLMLGVLGSNIDFETGQVKLSKDDVLILYTDGVTEAMNKENEEFGTERLEKTILSNLKESSEKIMQTIHNEIELFAKGLHQYDDITLIALKKCK
jgi:sigma-B regulation protein RsbU (phosphoserine phosphatase)